MPDNHRVKVRMYRHGLGDCFLVMIPRDDTGGTFKIVIDCGVILGTKDPSTKMKSVVDDLALATGKEVDLLVITHEHWDHVSGFQQVDDWASFKVGQVWFGWTENPKDDLANKLDKAKNEALALLMQMSGQRHLAGSDSGQLDGILGFFGIGAEGEGATGDALGASSTRSARDKAKQLGPVSYHTPGETPTLIGKVGGPRIFVLGPPHDEAKIKRYAPSTSNPETYDFATSASGQTLSGAFIADDPDRPFGFDQTIPLDHARGMAFFRDRYWGKEAVEDGTGNAAPTSTGTEDHELAGMLRDQSWRRIDDAWTESSNDLALQLDSATNNTSLVLAIELEPGGDVLLFAGDAQVGNWLSWHDVTWMDGGREITGTDLIRRTLLYKVGHHGSHNATLKERGLELMTHPSLIAMVPVDHEMAVTKGWDEIPRPSLMQRLHERAKGRVLRSDDTKPLSGMFDHSVANPADWKAFTNRVALGPGQADGRPLWYEVTL